MSNTAMIGIVVIVVAIIAGVTAGLMTTPEEENNNDDVEEIRIDYIHQYDAGEPVWAPFQQGAYDFAEGKNIDVNFQFAGGSAADMGPMIEDALAAGTDGLAIWCDEPEAIETEVEEALDEDVPVVATGIDMPDLAPAFAGLGPAEDLGRLYGEGLEPYLEDGDEVLFTSPAISPRDIGYREAAENYWEEQGLENIEVNHVETGWERAEIEDFIYGHLSAHPDRYAGIANTGNQGAGVTYTTLEDLGMEPGEIPVVGIDLLAETVEGMREGYITATTSWYPWQSAYYAGAMLYPEIRWGLKPPEEVLTGVDLIYEEDLDEIDYEGDRW